ncbi:MAG: hypothetical protein P9M14_05515 [Candidatus Alcyoniella australis]|nr:hypothetical protein [Candidatus Alcyoniella australis]
MPERSAGLVERSIPWLTPLLVLAWTTRVAVGVNYDQALIYPVVFAGIAACVVGLWRTRRPVFKPAMLTLCLAATFVVGLAAIVQGGHTRRIQSVATELMLDQLASGYTAVHARYEAIDSCTQFPCVAETVFGYGLWNGLVVYLENDRSFTFYREIPLRDPWGCRLKLECEGDRFVLRSSGPDRRLGNADDITASGTLEQPSTSAFAPQRSSATDG